MPAIDALIGLVAFQNEYIDRRELLDAFAIWTSDTSVPLATILVEKGYITSDDCSLLGQIAARHLKNHVDPTELFSQMSSNLMLQEDLNQIASRDDSIKKELAWFSQSIPLAANSRLNDLERPNHAKSDAQIADGIHRFRIVKEHARGGLGVVYVAEDRQFRRMVALKQIRNDRADQELYRQKFQQEAEVTGQLEHPGIVPIYALGMDEKGKPFYAMRFIKGETLQDSIAQFHGELKQNNTRFDSPIMRQLLRRFIDVCNAIEYAHERGVIHRDLKPGNVMLGKHGETLVVDWGLAKPLGPKRGRDGTESIGLLGESPVSKNEELSGAETRYGTFLGTAAYAPPEQLRGELDQMSPASDVYSLGAILFELLTGQQPIKVGNSVDDILKQIGELETNGPRAIRSDIPQALAFVCSKAMSVNPQARYACVRELRDDTQRWLDDQAIKGMKEPIASKLSRWVRNHQKTSASAVVGLLVSAVLLSFLYITKQNAFSTEKKLRQDAELANRETQKANLDLQLNAAKLARNRGQFREASRIMQEVKQQTVLSGPMALVLVRDLYFAQDIKDALIEIDKIDRNGLSIAEQAEFDLLSGDMMLLTRNDLKGFALIKKALKSESLSAAEAAYGEALVAETADDCIRHFDGCLHMDPFNSNALSRRGICCLIVGRVRDAKESANLGSRLFPDDMRFPFLTALIHAIRGEQDASRAALKALADQGGYEQEIGVIEVVSKLQSRFATGILGGEPSATTNAAELIESGRIIFDLVKLISSKYGDSPRMGFPQSSWMGKLFRSMPTSPFEVASLVAGFKSITTKIVEIQQLAPNHQVLNYLAGQAYFGEGKFRKSYELFRLSSQSDAIIDGITSRACWWGFLSFLTDTVLSKSQLNEPQLVELLQLVIDLKRNDGKFITTPVPEDLAWCMLIRARFYGLAIELAQQELAIESKPSKFKWQDRLDATLDLKKKNDELTEAALERYKPKS